MPDDFRVGDVVRNVLINREGTVIKVTPTMLQVDDGSFWGQIACVLAHTPVGKVDDESQPAA